MDNKYGSPLMIDGAIGYANIENAQLLKAQLIKLNDSYLEGVITKSEWIARLNNLVSKAELVGIDLFNERGN